MNDPIEQFKIWMKKAIESSNLQQKRAICVSTISEDGYPSSRFVDLKEVADDGFIFCTDMASPKGQQISANPKVGLTMWMDHVGYQIRIQGHASAMSPEASLRYWKSRSREARLTTLSSTQSEELSDKQLIAENLKRLSNLYTDCEISIRNLCGRDRRSPRQRKGSAS